jgi:purine-cytosine permease-like protein
MFLIFVAGALATLPSLGEIHSLADLWRIAETRIWLETPRGGTDRLGFWHITFFAWFCNLAMHIGLSDMALFRYAKRWTYGFYSAFGMYLGHYLAWICAGVMGAAVAEGLNPGEMADKAAGIAGVLAVLLAGWTTANPTIYRAGLALQIATPNWPRWLITIVAGLITTIVGFFPVIFMQLLGFVALYGLSLMPIGAIIFTEHWLFPKLGLRQYWAQRQRKFVNLPALITWLAVLVITFPLGQFTDQAVRLPMDMMGIHLFFRWLPGWFLSVGLYVALCYAMPGVRRRPGEADEPPAAAAGGFPVITTGAAAGPPARTAAAATNPSTPAQKPASLGPVAWIAGAVALASLIACLVLPARVFLAGTEWESAMVPYKTGLIVATITYFAAAIVWTSQREKAQAV